MRWTFDQTSSEGVPLKRLLLAVLLGAALAFSGCAPRARPVSASALPRSFSVSGKSAPLDWIAVRDGRLVVHGFINVSSGADQQLTLTAPQRFGGLTVFHVLPCFGDRSTEVVDNGRALTFSGERSDIDKYALRYLVATLSLRDGQLHIDRLVLSDRVQDWNGENNFTEYPPDVGSSLGPFGRRELHGGAPMSRSREWASIAPPSAASVLTGRIESTTSSQDDSGKFDGAFFDLLIPDRVAGVPFVHVARVAVVSQAKLSQIERRLDAQESDAQLRVIVRDERNRLVFEDFR